MCQCTPEIRTPFCGKGTCVDPYYEEQKKQVFTCDCGFSWQWGKSSEHICGPYYHTKIAKLEAEIIALKAASGFETIGFVSENSFKYLSERGGFACVTKSAFKNNDVEIFVRIKNESAN